MNTDQTTSNDGSILDRAISMCKSGMKNPTPQVMSSILDELEQAKQYIQEEESQESGEENQSGEPADMHNGKTPSLAIMIGMGHKGNKK